MGKRGRCKGLGGGAAGGVLVGGDWVEDLVGAAPFWAGRLGGKSCGDDAMRDNEQFLVGETGPAGFLDLLGKGGWL